jgi:2-succinyl-6-hydroxy-2,4-cyclohexadiene-1-carboxylate synthase
MIPGRMAPPLVLLHGFTNTGASWEPVISALGERYRAIAPDIRGHGSASDVRPVSLEGVIEDVASVAPPPEGFELVGYSMGGRVALHVALALGAERVKRLVLISASPGRASARERETRRRVDEQLADGIERMDIEQFADRWARTPVLADQPPRVTAAARVDRLRNTPAGLAAALRALGTGALPSVWDRLGELTMPVMMIVGGRDERFQAVAVRMAGRVPHAEVAIVAGAGHAVHLENPEEVARLIAL